MVHTGGPETFLEILEDLNRQIGWNSLCSEDNRGLRKIFLLHLSIYTYRGSFPGGSDVNLLAMWETQGFNPWVRKIPWRRAWPPTLVFLTGEFHGQKRLVDHSPYILRIWHD